MNEPVREPTRVASLKDRLVSEQYGKYFESLKKNIVNSISAHLREMIERYEEDDQAGEGRNAEYYDSVHISFSRDGDNVKLNLTMLVNEDFIKTSHLRDLRHDVRKAMGQLAEVPAVGLLEKNPCGPRERVRSASFAEKTSVDASDERSEFGETFDEDRDFENVEPRAASGDPLRWMGGK